MRRSFDIRRMRPAAVLAGLVLLALTADPTVALDDGGGRSVFATGAGNRALALGGAYTAVADDASAPLWNPAGLALLPRRQLHATQTSLFGLGFSEQYASLAVPDWRWGTAAITYRRFAVDGIEGRDARGFLYADDLRDAETEVALSYGNTIAGRDLAIGGSVKVQTHQLAGYSGSGLGADLGVWARPLALTGLAGGSRALRLGLAVRNAIEPEVRLDRDPVPDPLTARAGLAWSARPVEALGLLLAMDVEHSRDMDARWHLGVEGRLHDVLALRAGHDDGTLTAGVGLRWSGVGADYQYEDHELGDVHRFGIALSFGATTADSRRAHLAAEEAALQTRLQDAFEARLRGHAGDIEGMVRRALDAGAWRDALDAVGTLAVLAPEHPQLAALEADAWRGMGEDQERASELAAAAVSYRRALALQPDHRQIAADLARVQEAGDRRAERSRALKERYDAALAAFAGDDLTTARDGFAAVLELAPADADAAKMLARTRAAITRRASNLANEAEALAQAGRPDAAREHLDAAARLDAGAPGLDSAAALVRNAERLAATRSAAAPETATVVPTPMPHAVQEDANEALSPERRSELDDLYRRGVEAMEAGRRDDAVRFWEIVWTADPAHAQVRDHLVQEYLARGMEAYASGALRDAVASWRLARRVDPDDPRARGYLERAQQQLDRMETISSGG